MPFDKRRLMEFLKVMDEELDKPIELTAVGGTAMTLLGLKDSTADMDFDLEERHASEFKKVLETLPHGYRIDIYTGGLIFSQQLPDDYVEKRIPVETDYRNIRLYALHPLDIIVSKTGRLNDRDIEDIKVCIRKYKLTREQIRSRATEVEYAGSEENYETNLRYVLEHLF